MKAPSILLLSSLLYGCATYARQPAEYVADTTHLLADAGPELSACYAKVLALEPGARGVVTVRLRVEARTGQLGADVVPERTTAPELVQSCVIRQVATLKLAPPDVSDAAGEASWTFKPLKAPAR